MMSALTRVTPLTGEVDLARLACLPLQVGTAGEFQRPDKLLRRDRLWQNIYRKHLHHT